MVGFRVLCRSSWPNSEKSKLLVALTSVSTERGFKCRLNFTRSNRRSYLRVHPHVTRGGQILSQAIDVFCSVDNTFFFNTSLKSTGLICLLCSAVSFAVELEKGWLWLVSSVSDIVWGGRDLIRRCACHQRGVREKFEVRNFSYLALAHKTLEKICLWAK